jgi:hypothetical protein
MRIESIDSMQTNDMFLSNRSFMPTVVEQIQRKRKSKSDQENRVFLCDFCTKSYLSYPALYTHRKNKHGEYVMQDRKSNKGRPSSKKQNQTRVIDPKKDDYFYVEGRCRTKENHCDDLGKLFDEVQKELYGKKSKKHFHIRSKLSSIEVDDLTMKHKKPLLGAILTPSKTCDEVLALYIGHVSLLASVETVRQVIKLVLMYREYYNSRYKCANLDEEYSVVETAEKIPEVSNHFIKDIKKDVRFDPKMATDLVSNMCEWMYQNSYTNYSLLFNV